MTCPSSDDLLLENKENAFLGRGNGNNEGDKCKKNSNSKSWDGEQCGSGDKQLHYQVLLELVLGHVRDTYARGTIPSPCDGSKSESSLDVDDLTSHLVSPLDSVIKDALATDVKALEKGNTVLKPYITQLNNFKASLTDQLKHITDNASFTRLGISKDSSDAAIKKAYHAMAVKCHPDKGG